MYIKNPEYFITTVREGSISKAAEKLYLSQRADGCRVDCV